MGALLASIAAVNKPRVTLRLPQRELQQSWGRKNTRPAFTMLQELRAAVTMRRNVAR